MSIGFRNLYPYGIRTSSEDEKWAKELYETAFPSDERRDFRLLLPLTLEESLRFYIITASKDEPIGIISLWDFERFAYIEHFAISDSLRSGGYGSKVLDIITKIIQKPIVLEVEPPTDDLSCRRVEFYGRAGFEILPFDYIQPPYDDTKSALSMKIMYFGDKIMDEEFFSFMVGELYSRVYGKSSTNQAV